MSSSRYILGSRSPRRRELLKLLVPDDRIVAKPPLSPQEAGFAGLRDRAAITARLQEIVQEKRRDVESQLADKERSAIRIVADTIIVASTAEDVLTVLGQPPAENWQAAVREWFTNYYSGRTHEAWTGVCVWSDEGILVDEIVSTAVTFRTIAPAEIEWYLATGESRGKAGGYALQGLASLFVSRVEGSLSNVVGLPLEVLRLVIGSPKR